MTDDSWYQWIALNRNPNPNVSKETKILIYEYCREAMMDYAFDCDHKDRLFVISDNLDRHMEKAEEYIERWNKHFNQSVKIETIQLETQKAARIVNNSISILYPIFYSVLRGDKKDYRDGGLLDYCIENGVGIKELQDYETYLMKDIFTMDREDDNWTEINGPIDYFDHFKYSWRRKK